MSNKILITISNFLELNMIDFHMRYAAITLIESVRVMHSPSTNITWPMMRPINVAMLCCMDGIQI